MSGNTLNNTEVAEETEIRQAAEPAPAETLSAQEPLQHPVTPANKWGSWKEIVDKISYKGIVRNMPYLMFLTVLCMLYITNNNKAISLTRSINDKSKELKELRWKYMDIQSRLMYQTSETQLVPKAQVLGLQPLDKPAFEIKETVAAPAED